MAGLTHAVRLFVAHYGLIALFVLLTIEEAGVWLPLPGDLLIVYFGYRVAHSHAPVLGAIPVLLTVTAAVLCGSTLLYLLVRRFRWILHRVGPIIHLDEKRLGWMEGWIQRRGSMVIIPGRLVPGLRIPTTVVAGAFGIPLPVFLPAVAIAAVIWGILYFVIGAAGGIIIDAVRDPLQSESAEWVLPVIAGLALLAVLLRWQRSRTHTGNR